MNETTTGFIDALSFTFRPARPDIPYLLGCLRGWLGDFPHQTRKNGLHGYDQSIELAGLGTIAFGGEAQKGSVLVQLLGVACARIEDWPLVLRMLRQWNAKLTRVDLTVDVLDGHAYNLDIATQDYRDKKFGVGGRHPKCDCYGDWINNRARTLYIGSVESGKLLRIYDKGAQMRSEKWPNWVRIELELHPKDRFIPWSVLLQPLPFLAGSYPALNWLHNFPDQLRTHREIALRTISQCLDVARNQAGRAAHAALVYHSGDVQKAFNEIHRHELPARLIGFSTLAEKRLKETQNVNS